MDYKNKYGFATLTLVGPKTHVSKIIGKEVIASGHGFDLCTAASLALITENKRLQIGYESISQQYYIVYHNSPTEVQICRPDLVISVEDNPYETLAKINKYSMLLTNKII